MTHQMLTVLLALGLASRLRASDSIAPFQGDYAGWAYQTGGGDLPLRWHIMEKAGRLAVFMDVPHQKAFGLGTQDVQLEEGTIRFQRVNSQGKLWRYEATLDQGVLRGVGRLEEETTLTLELHRSALALPTIDPKRYVDCQGVFRDGPRSIVISSWFWGELLYTDLSTGRHGTLFPISETEFFAGPSMYVPTSIVARARFERDPQGQVHQLIWNQDAGTPLKATRVHVREEEVEFTNGDVTLFGTLLRPAGTGPYPAVVMLGGSNWKVRADVRNNADLFVSMGLAALIYDQRGNGKSTGKAVCSFDETASDARAAVAMLRQRSDVHTDSIGLWGASRGGWFAPLAASQCPDVSFMILFVPPAVSPARQESTRRLNALRAEGFSEDRIREGAEYLELLWKSTGSDEDWDRYEAAKKRMAEAGLLDHLGGTESKESEDYQWDKLNMRHDPIPYLERVTCPVLAFFGGNDTNVTPDENKGPMENAFLRGGNKDFTLLTLPGANHALQIQGPSSSQAGKNIHLGVGYAPTLWNTIQSWLDERFPARASPG